jgi:hypothetical protein
MSYTRRPAKPKAQTNEVVTSNTTSAFKFQNLTHGSLNGDSIRMVTSKAHSNNGYFDEDDELPFLTSSTRRKGILKRLGARGTSQAVDASSAWCCGCFGLGASFWSLLITVIFIYAATSLQWHINVEQPPMLFTHCAQPIIRSPIGSGMFMVKVIRNCAFIKCALPTLALYTANPFWFIIVSIVDWLAALVSAMYEAAVTASSIDLETENIHVVLPKSKYDDTPIQVVNGAMSSSTKKRSTTAMTPLEADQFVVTLNTVSEGDVEVDASSKLQSSQYLTIITAVDESIYQGRSIYTPCQVASSGNSNVASSIAHAHVWSLVIYQQDVQSSVAKRSTYMNQRWVGSLGIADNEYVTTLLVVHDNRVCQMVNTASGRRGRLLPMNSVNLDQPPYTVHAVIHVASGRRTTSLEKLVDLGFWQNPKLERWFTMFDRQYTILSKQTDASLDGLEQEVIQSNKPSRHATSTPQTQMVWHSFLLNDYKQASTSAVQHWHKLQTAVPISTPYAAYVIPSINTKSLTASHITSLAEIWPKTQPIVTRNVLMASDDRLALSIYEFDASLKYESVRVLQSPALDVSFWDLGVAELASNLSSESWESPLNEQVNFWEWYDLFSAVAASRITNVLSSSPSNDDDLPSTTEYFEMDAVTRRAVHQQVRSKYAPFFKNRQSNPTSMVYLSNDHSMTHFMLKYHTPAIPAPPQAQQHAFFKFDFEKILFHLSSQCSYDTSPDRLNRFGTYVNQVHAKIDAIYSPSAAASSVDAPSTQGQKTKRSIRVAANSNNQLKQVAGATHQPTKTGHCFAYAEAMAWYRVLHYHVNFDLSDMSSEVDLFHMTRPYVVPIASTSGAKASVNSPPQLAPATLNCNKNPKAAWSVWRPMMEYKAFEPQSQSNLVILDDNDEEVDAQTLQPSAALKQFIASWKGGTSDVGNTTPFIHVIDPLVGLSPTGISECDFQPLYDSPWRTNVPKQCLMHPWMNELIQTTSQTIQACA